LGAFEINEPLPELKEPHALAILRPWIDVGNIGTLTLSWLEKHTNAERLAELARPGSYFDFTRYRPVLYGSREQRQVVIPNSYITYGRQEEGHDFLFLHLLEPHMLGEIYVDSVLQLLARFGVKRYFLIGSMYDFVPHTRPPLVTGGASSEEAKYEIERAGVSSSDYEGPTTICFLISQRAPEWDIESATIVVHLPQYTQLDEDYMGAVRLNEVISSMYGIPVDEASIVTAERQREQITAEVAGNPQMQEIVEQLEYRYDARIREEKEKEEPHTLSPEVEEFLREMERRFRRE
jgi:predicted ATP-grasp superfamily ATP-dependent carboligase